MTETEARTTEERMQRNAKTLAWMLPFFAPAVSRVSFRADDRPPTACVDLRGVIRANPDYVKTLTDPQLRFVIAHELFHLMLLHHDRGVGRRPFKWNRATDRIVNLTLTKISEQAGEDSISPLPDLLYAKEEQAEWTAEQLYEVEPDWLEGCLVYDPTQVPIGQGCGPALDGGDDENGLRSKWRQVAVQAQFYGRQAGDVAGNALANLLDIPLPKVRWSEVLRGQLSQALAEAGYDDVTWNWQSRRSTAEILLPGDVTYKCKAAVVIDTSGSMSDEDLRRAVAETEAIVNHTSVAVFLVVHDFAVQEACWIKPGARSHVHGQIQKRLKGRGGTSFDEAYQRVEKEGRFNVCVHLTDGEVVRWPPKPRTARKLVVALLGSRNRADVPSDARIIEVEV